MWTQAMIDSIIYKKLYYLFIKNHDAITFTLPQRIFLKCLGNMIWYSYLRLNLSPLKIITVRLFEINSVNIEDLLRRFVNCIFYNEFT